MVGRILDLTRRVRAALLRLPPVDTLRRSLASFFVGECPMHAAGLTYYSLLAIVPILCLLLYFAKSCGVDEFARNQINARIDAAITNVENAQDEKVMGALAATGVIDMTEIKRKRIAALEFGKQARAISNELFDRVDKFDMDTLGWIGFVFLLWTAISSLGTVEDSLNRIWAVAKPRPIWHRTWLYLAIALVLPIMSALAMSLPILGATREVIDSTLGANASTRWMSKGLVWLLENDWVRRLFTLAISSLVLAVFYKVLPHCRVRFRSAWWGGLFAAVVFGVWMKICAFAQVGIARSSALYGSFALLPIVLAWIYIGWQIVLFGACVVKSSDDRFDKMVVKSKEEK